MPAPSAALLTRPHRHDHHSRTPTPAAAPESQPWFPWRLHVHNPRPAPPPPDPFTGLTEYQRGRPPVAWGTQCRDCWGFVDDPRHLLDESQPDDDRG